MIFSGISARFFFQKFFQGISRNFLENFFTNPTGIGSETLLTVSKEFFEKYVQLMLQKFINIFFWEFGIAIPTEISPGMSIEIAAEFIQIFHWRFLRSSLLKKIFKKMLKEFLRNPWRIRSRKLLKNSFGNSWIISWKYFGGNSGQTILQKLLKLCSKQFLVEWNYTWKTWRYS